MRVVSAPNAASNNYWVNAAKCQNIADAGARSECNDEKKQTYSEDVALCGEQKAERVDVCSDLGEAPYDPQIDPADFVNPLQIGSSIAANPFLILTPGYTRKYESLTEKITVVMTHKTVKIQGVTCLVSRDTARDMAGNLLEDTFDYFVQDVLGNVWYFGETTAEYEGGIPVSVEGSFKAGEGGAKPGIGMQAVLTPGTLYREEFSLGTAEDLAEIITTKASESAPAASCSHTCLRTDNSTPISPGDGEVKFYAPGIGEIVSFPEGAPTAREVLVEYHY